MIILKEKYDSKKIILELDKLVKEAFDLFDDFSNCRISGITNVKKMEIIEALILYNLIEKTNFEEIFDSLCSSYGDPTQSFRTIIYSLVCGLGKRGLSPTFNNFLIITNKRIRELKRKKIKKYSYYIPARIEFELTDNEILSLKKKIKLATGISIRNPSKKIINKINSEKFKRFISNRNVIIKIDIKARDQFYPIKIINNKVSTFLGILFFSNNYGRDYNKLIVKGNDTSISEIPVEDHFLIVENNKNIVYCPEDFQIEDSEVSLIGKKRFRIHKRVFENYSTILYVLDRICKQIKKIKSLTNESFKLYQEATVEKHLGISFLKFWIITENLLKQGRKRTDESLLSFIKKMMKDKYSRGLIDEVYKKRNELVHRFKSDFISQQDRNLSKNIAEQMIYFLLKPPVKIKNIEELNIMLDNIMSSKYNLKTKMRIIQKIIRKRN